MAAPQNQSQPRSIQQNGAASTRDAGGRQQIAQGSAPAYLPICPKSNNRLGSQYKAQAQAGACAPACKCAVPNFHKKGRWRGAGVLMYNRGGLVLANSPGASAFCTQHSARLRRRKKRSMSSWWWMENVVQCNGRQGEAVKHLPLQQHRFNLVVLVEGGACHRLRMQPDCSLLPPATAPPRRPRTRRPLLRAARRQTGPG